MPFLWAITLLAWVHAIALTKHLHAKNPTSWAHWTILMVLTAPFLDTIRLSFDPAGAVIEYNWYPPAFLGFGLMTAVLYGRKFYGLYHAGGDANRAGWRAGISLSCLVLSLYVSGAALDHLVFFRPGELSGFAGAHGLGVTDVDCGVTVVVRLREGGADYRCPQSVVFGMGSSTPFAPWPSYT